MFEVAQTNQSHDTNYIGCLNVSGEIKTSNRIKALNLISPMVLWRPLPTGVPSSSKRKWMRSEVTAGGFRDEIKPGVTVMVPGTFIKLLMMISCFIDVNEGVIQVFHPSVPSDLSHQASPR